MVPRSLARRVVPLFLTAIMLFAGCLQGVPEETTEQPTVVREVGLLGEARGESPFAESVPLTEDIQAVAVELSITNLNTEQWANATASALVDGEVVWTEEVTLEKLAVTRAFNETRSEGDEDPRLETETGGPDWAAYLEEDIPVDGSEAEELTLVVDATDGAVAVDGWLRAKAIPGPDALAQADSTARVNES